MTVTALDIQLKLETAITADGKDYAFTTRGLSVILGIPQPTLNHYFERLKSTQNDPRKTLEQARAMGLRPTQNTPSNSLYVFSEHVDEVIDRYEGKYPQIREFTKLIRKLGILTYLSQLHGTPVNTSEVIAQIDSLWKTERLFHRQIWQALTEKTNAPLVAEKLMVAYYGMTCEQWRNTHGKNPNAPDTWVPDFTSTQQLRELNILRSNFARQRDSVPFETRIERAVARTRAEMKKL